MAISKERLEEKIKNGDTGIYIRYINRDYNIKLEDIIDDEGFHLAYEEVKKGREYIDIPFTELYESREDYENYMKTEREKLDFDLEFRNITRTETLSLSTWDEMNEQLNDSGSYERDGYLYELHNNVLSVYQTFCMEYNKIYEGTFTKEHYIEACKICKKLFLGEKMEG